MEKYLGVKIISAEPMSQDQFAGAKNFRDLSKLSGGIDREGYKVVYEDGDVSWSPKEVFEKAYRRIDNLTFGLAIEALKLGKKVCRAGWNGKGMYLKLVQGYPVNGHLNATTGKRHDDGRTDSDKDAMLNIPETCPDGSPNITHGNPGQMLSHIVMKTAGDSKYWGEGYSDSVPWLASQTDVLSEDWEIVD